MHLASVERKKAYSRPSPSMVFVPRIEKKTNTPLISAPGGGGAPQEFSILKIQIKKRLGATKELACSTVVLPLMKALLRNKHKTNVLICQSLYKLFGSGGPKINLGR
jgi:hypothetical protein